MNSENYFENRFVEVSETLVNFMKEKRKCFVIYKQISSTNDRLLKDRLNLCLVILHRKKIKEKRNEKRGGIRKRKGNSMFLSCKSASKVLVDTDKAH